MPRDKPRGFGVSPTNMSDFLTNLKAKAAALLAKPTTVKVVVIAAVVGFVLGAILL